MALRTLGLWFIILVAVGAAAAATGIDYVGLQITLPIGDVPLLVGIDIGARVSSGWAIASLLLDASRRSVLLGTYEIPLTEDSGSGTSLIALSAGILYFDPRAIYPTPVFGGGLSYHDTFAETFQAGLTGEILYPLALGPPLLALQAGWVAP